jgi:hypothetical protein
MTGEGEKFRELFLENILLFGVCEAKKKNSTYHYLQTHMTPAPAHVAPQKSMFQSMIQTPVGSVAAVDCSCNAVFTGANGSTVCIIAPGRNAGNSTYTDASG